MTTLFKTVVGEAFDFASLVSDTSEKIARTTNKVLAILALALNNPIKKLILLAVVSGEEFKAKTGIKGSKHLYVLYGVDEPVGAPTLAQLIIHAGHYPRMTPEYREIWKQSDARSYCYGMLTGASERLKKPVPMEDEGASSD